MSSNPDLVNVDQPRPLNDDQNPFAGFDIAGSISTIFKTAGQVLGAILLLIGVYYSLSILGQILEAGRDPQKLAQAQEKMVELLDLKDAKVVVDNETIPLGKVAGFGAVVIWFVLSLWIPLTLIAAGTKLVWGPLAERKAFYNALGEFFRNARAHESRRKR